MSKGKKRSKKGAPTKAQRFAHENPFSSLKKEIKKTGKRAPPPPAHEEPPPSGEAEGEAMWKRFYEQVDPLKGDERVPPPRPAPPPPAPAPPAPDDDVIAELSDLVSGEGDFDIESLDEYVSGIAPGVDRRLLKKLKAGTFSWQDYLDLHGFIWVEARDAIIAFIEDARRTGKRCVLIVHGRGLHSKGPVATLKTNLVSLLTRGPLRRQVLAFATARSVDGGPGAIYVLLRKRRPLHG